MAALGSICVELASHPIIQRDVDTLWERYLSYLPLKSDVEESAKVTLQLCRLTKAGSLGLLGAQRQRLPRVWTLLLEAIGESGTTDTVLQSIAETIKGLSAALQPDEMSQLWASTKPEVAARAQELVRAP